MTTSELKATYKNLKKSGHSSFAVYTQNLTVILGCISKDDEIVKIEITAATSVEEAIELRNKFKNGIKFNFAH